MTKFGNRANGYYNITGVGILPSVTTILGVLDKGEGLRRWFITQGAAIQKLKNPKDDKELYKLFQEMQNKSMSRGSRVHSMIEAYFKTGVLLDPLVDDPCYNAFKDFLKEYKVKPLHIEQEVYSRDDGYAGTCDMIAEINGRIAVIDWKTGKKARLYNTTHLQLSAYAKAAVEMGLIPKFDTLFAVCFGEDGKYADKQYTYDYEAFKHVQGAWEWNSKWSS